MILRPTELIAGAASGLEITRCEDPAELAVACAVAAAGFEVPPDRVAALYTARLAKSPGESVYVAQADGVPVSTATA